MTAADATAATTAPPHGRALIVVASMLPMVLDILDRTIVNVALPNMMGALGATSDQITWILTTYLVSSAVVMPLTGYLVDRLGQRRLLIFSIAGFIVASVLCALSTSLGEIVVWRVVQGVSGASLVPLSQAILLVNFPREQRGRAMALWAIGVMVAPVMGPTLGGYLTAWGDWRWVFLVNVPIGLAGLLLAWRAVPQTATKEVKTDWAGLVLMSVGISALQIVLDRGNQEDWFASGLILALAIVAPIALTAFVWRGWDRPDNIVNLRLFTDRNFAASNLILCVAALGIYAVIAAQPLMLENLFDYPPQTTGLVMAPTGIAAAIVMGILGRILDRIDARYAVALGLICGAVSAYMRTNYNLEISPYWIILPGILQGAGMGLLFVPLATLAYATLSDDVTHEAAGLFSLTRTVSASIGISIMSTVLERETQINWNILGGHINPNNPALYQWLAERGLTLDDLLAPQRLGHALERQATMIAFIDVFWLVGLGFLIVLPMLLLLRRAGSGKGPMSA